MHWIVKKTNLYRNRWIDNLLNSRLRFAVIFQRWRCNRIFSPSLQLPYYLACSLVFVESTTIAVCLAIAAMAVCIVHPLLDAPFMWYGVARHVGSEYS